MEIIYSKYSRERAPEFQVKTTIFKDNNITYVSKEALNNLGKQHIQQIYHNYEILKKVYPEEWLVKPIEHKNGQIIFEFFGGVSLEQLLLEACIKKDESEFIQILDQYNSFLEGFFKDNYCEFIHTSAFINNFGERSKLLGLKSFNVANIDLNFDNILLNDGDYKILDYEWVYVFPVPLNFVKFRAVNNFYYNHFNVLRRFIQIEKMFSHVGITEDELTDYTEMANIFADTVGSGTEKSSLNKYLKQAIPFQFSEPVKHKAQLFFGKNREFKEEESIPIEVISGDQSLTFELSNKGEISYFRFDPIESNCLLYMSEIKLIDSDGCSTEIKRLDTNANFIDNNLFVFIENDPQIVYEAEQKRYQSLEVKFSVFWEYPESVVVQLVNNVRSCQQWFSQISPEIHKLGELLRIRERELTDQPVKIETMLKLITEQSNKREEEIVKLKQYLNNKLLDFDMLKDDLKSKNIELEEFADRYSALNSDYIILQQEYSELQQEATKLDDLLVEKEKMIHDITSTKWWRVYTFLKRLKYLILRKR